jgi:phage N-6-adenine-methyltransferase
MTLVTAARVTKLGRPTVRKNGIPLTPAEKQKRYRARLRREHRKSHRARVNGWYEWYTPAEYIEAARAVLGTIDLDPASSEIAQTLVQAREFFTAERDGLAQQWHGNVWLNPPYSRDFIGRFIDKLLLEIRAGRAQQAILLVHAYTDTEWFRRAAAVSAALCLTKRIRFWSPDGRSNRSPTQGQAFLYYGDNVDGFRKAFAGFGIVR